MRKGLVLSGIAPLALLLLSGCGAKQDQQAHADMAGKTITIATGDFYEACDTWEPGEKVSFEFISSMPVQFDVHYHQKHAKMYAIDRTVTDKFSGSFVVQSDDIHCCMWKNNNAKFITLTYDMSVEGK